MTHGRRVAGRVVGRIGGAAVVVQPDGEGHGFIEAQLPPPLHKGHGVVVHVPFGLGGAAARVIEYEAAGHLVRVAKVKETGASK
jgi:hypothetical protein